MHGHIISSEKWIVRLKYATVINHFLPSFNIKNKQPSHKLRVLDALQKCRTEYMGGHVEACQDCGEIHGEIPKGLFEKEWVIYAKQPFGESKQVINYLGRYTPPNCNFKRQDY